MELIDLRGTDRDWMPALGELFFDVIDGGGSLGFLEDIDEAQMREYWEGVFDQLGPRHRLWVCRDRDRALGTVQLSLCGKPNGRHRAEVQKLMVHRDARRRGVAAQLMAALERVARDEGLRLLVLDTEVDSPAETFYRAQGFQRAGEIPDFATSPQGELRGTALYWKRLP
ncbi:acetyltransferase [Mitsuaria sp. BK045]|uniref:GNAT family N-acetyltransferase n=1 Tax=unclassified Roseateles TaxID=2626991 RepID=UPI001612F573|nr:MULTISPECIES: GNAT family N-acetyltransferase [unclassified Roseateles]MBB3291375.1 acetyltransferase [Mitsuaria sp. BK041]MBB3360592.1 acetyltransferase [Mitsuaria sp. BK045]